MTCEREKYQREVHLIGSPIFKKAKALPGWLYISHVLLYAIRKAAWGLTEMLPFSNYISRDAIIFIFINEIQKK